MRFTAAVFLVLFLLPALARADQREDGLTAYGRRDYPTALKVFKPLAEKGDADACGLLGQMYDEGSGSVKQDYAEAYFWYKLDELLGTGAGADIHAWAPAERLTPAQESATLKRVLEWSESKAKQGRANFQYVMGQIYEEGDGVKKDLGQAYFWYSLAVKYGGVFDDRWPDEGNLALTSKDAVGKLLAPEQKAAADERVREWKQTPAPP